MAGVNNYRERLRSFAAQQATHTTIISLVRLKAVESARDDPHPKSKYVETDNRRSSGRPMHHGTIHSTSEAPTGLFIRLQAPAGLFTLLQFRFQAPAVLVEMMGKMAIPHLVG